LEEFYYELTIIPENSVEIFADLITTLTGEAIEINKDSIVARSEESLEDIEFGINEFASAVGIACQTKLEKKKNEDWIKKYQESVKSIEVGQFFVRPSWEDKKEDKIDIIIDPALSFGSGHHETTNACLEAVSAYV